MTHTVRSPRTSVYVDGFNLYYAIRDSPNSKWLDILALCHSYLRTYDIQDIKYFTAKIAPRPTDPYQHVRQKTYIQALQTLPGLTVIYGHFLSHPVTMTVYPVTSPPTRVRVLKTEEKGSDVNLAAHMLNDAHLDHFDVAVVISNDSDLLMPIKMVRGLGKRVEILRPPTPYPSQALIREVNLVRPIRISAIQSSQFPPIVTTINGKLLHKPTTW
jgi:uncharacterized LabA/DUF88 family protein